MAELITEKDFDGLVKMIKAGNQFKLVKINVEDESPSSPQYSVAFMLGGKGLEFKLYTQLRSDREKKLRLFRSIDTAVGLIKRTGYKGYIVMDC